MSTPLVSVIIPAYNASRWIGDALRSVLSQGITDLEVLLVNDGSTDDTSRVARNFKDPRIRIFEISNSGVSAARNIGIRHARGEFIGFLDADDAMEPGNLEQKITSLERSHVHWAFADIALCDERLEPTGEILTGGDSDVLQHTLLGTGNTVPAPCSNLVARRRCFDKGLRLDEDLSNEADRFLAIQLLREYEFVHIPQVLTRYRQVPGSMSRNIALYEADHLRLMDKVTGIGLLEDRRFRRQAWAAAFWAIGGSWWKNAAAPMKGIPYLIKAIAIRPALLIEKLKASI